LAIDWSKYGVKTEEPSNNSSVTSVDFSKYEGSQGDNKQPNSTNPSSSAPKVSQPAPLSEGTKRLITSVTTNPMLNPNIIPKPVNTSPRIAPPPALSPIVNTQMAIQDAVTAQHGVQYPQRSTLGQLGHEASVAFNAISKKMGQNATGMPAYGGIEDTSNRSLNALTDFIGGAGYLVDPSGQGYAHIGNEALNAMEGLLATKGAQKVIAPVTSLVSKLTKKGVKPSIANNIVSGGVKGAGVGAIEGFQQAGATNNDPVHGTEYGAALGGGLPVAGGLIKAGASKLSQYAKDLLTSKLAEITNNRTKAVLANGTKDFPLALPEPSAPRVRGNANGAVTPDVIHAPETGPRGLPQPSEAVAKQYRNAKEASDEIKNIDGELNNLNTRHQQAVNDQYQLLKNQMKNRGGVKQGNVLRDANGNVIGRMGRQSNNPQWYRDFFAQNGRKPNNKELFQLANKHIDEGYHEDGVQIPSWKHENNYDDMVLALNQVKQTLKESANVADVATSHVASPVVRVGRANSPLPEPPIQKVNAETTRIADMKPTAAKQATVASDLPGRVDAVMPTVPKPSQAVTGERKFVNTLEQSGKLNPQTAEGLGQSTKRDYNVITDEEAVAKANKAISNNMDKVEAEVLGATKPTKQHIVNGMRLIDELQKQGNTERAVTIAEKLAKHLTEAGQAVQAASIWNRLTPEGALIAAQRKVSRINENISRFGKQVEVTPKNAEDIKTAATIIQETSQNKERAGRISALMDKIKAKQPLTAEEHTDVQSFLKDLKSYGKEEKPPQPTREAKAELRTREKVISHLEQQAAEARAKWNAKRNLGFAAKLDEPDIVLLAKMAAPWLVKGALKPVEFAERLAKEFGEAVRPSAQAVYERAREIGVNGISKKQLSNAERISENFINTKQLGEEDANFIRSIAHRVANLEGKSKQQASQDLQAVLNGFERAGVGKKLAAAQYVTMLLNPLTQVRNIVGNELLYRLERLNRLIATPFDIVYSSVTGKPREITWKKDPNMWHNYFSQAGDYWSNLGEGLKAGWRGVDPEGVQSKYDIQGHAFTGKYNPMTYLEKSLGAVLKGFDYAAYQRAVNQRLGEMAYLDAINKGIPKSEMRGHIQNYLTNADDAINSIARDYGNFVTLQDDSVLSQKLSGWKRDLNKLSTGGRHGTENFGVGNLIIPFAKTPSNLLLRAMDYSPIGIGKALMQSGHILLKRDADLTRADVIQSVSRAILGTGIGAVAYWLAAKGALGGNLSSDPEVKKLQQQSGRKDFQINGSAMGRMIHSAFTGGNVDDAAKIQPGDTLWAYEWASPTSAPMAVGSNIFQGIKQGDSGLKTAANAVTGGINTILNSSVLSGIQQALKTNPGETNTFNAILGNLAKQVPGMFTPSIIKQLNTVLDNKQRELYDPNGVKNYFNPTLAKIPGAAQKMPQSVDTLGNPNTVKNSFFDVFLSPSQRATYNPTPAAQAVIQVLNESGDSRVAPRAVPKFLKGKDLLTGADKRVDLSAKQFVEFQTIVGQESARLISKINPNMPTDKKVKFIIDALDKAGQIGRNKIKAEVGLKK
jgi:hypothetical protein